MAAGILVNIGSGNGLLADGTKPLPEPMLTYQHLGPSGLAFTKSPNRKGLGKEYKGLETFDVSSPILCCFLGQLWQNLQISQKWDLKSQQPSANPGPSSDVHLRAILLEISQPSVTKISLKIIFLRFYWNLPGANELKPTHKGLTFSCHVRFSMWLLCFPYGCLNNVLLEKYGIRYPGAIFEPCLSG